MAFDGIIMITENGKELLAKAQTGETMTISKVIIGSGEPTLPIEKMSAMVNPEKELINLIYSGQNNVVDIACILKDSDTFKFSEIGIMAYGEDENEVLYAYGFSENPEMITPTTIKNIHIRIAVENTANTTVIINPEGEFVPYSEMAEFNDIKIGVIGKWVPSHILKYLYDSIENLIKDIDKINNAISTLNTENENQNISIITIGNAIDDLFIDLNTTFVKVADQAKLNDVVIASKNKWVDSYILNEYIKPINNSITELNILLANLDIDSIKSKLDSINEILEQLENISVDPTTFKTNEMGFGYLVSTTSQTSSTVQFHEFRNNPVILKNGLMFMARFTFGTTQGIGKLRAKIGSTGAIYDIFYNDIRIGQAGDIYENFCIARDFKTLMVFKESYGWEILNIDTGWIPLAYPDGITQINPLMYRKKDDIVYIKGAFSGISEATTIGQLPSGFRPELTTQTPIIIRAASSTHSLQLGNMVINKDGTFIVGSPQPIADNARIFINATIL